jgi:hypothetical protein
MRSHTSTSQRVVDLNCPFDVLTYIHMNSSIYIVLFIVAVGAIYLGEHFGKKAGGKKDDKHGGDKGKKH